MYFFSVVSLLCIHVFELIYVFHNSPGHMAPGAMGSTITGIICPDCATNTLGICDIRVVRRQGDRLPGLRVSWVQICLRRRLHGPYVCILCKLCSIKHYRFDLRWPKVAETLDYVLLIQAYHSNVGNIIASIIRSCSVSNIKPS